MSFSTKLTTEILNTINKQSLAYKYKKDYDVQLKDSRGKTKKRYRNKKKLKNKKYSFGKRSRSNLKLRRIYRKHKKQKKYGIKKKKIFQLFREKVKEKTYNQPAKLNLILIYFLKCLKLKFSQKKTTQKPLKVKDSYRPTLKNNLNILYKNYKQNIWLKHDTLQLICYNRVKTLNDYNEELKKYKKNLKRWDYKLGDFLKRRYRVSSER